LKGRESSIAPAITGVAGSILLLLLKAKLDNEILKEGQGMVQLEYSMGFWLTFLLFLFAAGWNGFLFHRGKKQEVMQDNHILFHFILDYSFFWLFSYNEGCRTQGNWSVWAVH